MLPTRSSYCVSTLGSRDARWQRTRTALYALVALFKMGPEVPRFPTSNQDSLGTHSRSLRRSSISFQPANSTREIFPPARARVPKKVRSHSDPLSLMPLRVSKGRGASDLQDRMALANSLFDWSSFKRGRVLCGRRVASVVILATVESKWRVSRLLCAERNVARQSRP